jgi:hypothetical protein
MRAIACPVCHDVVDIKGFPSHANSLHAMHVPYDANEVYLKRRFTVLGGLVLGEYDPVKKRFVPEGI